MLLCDIAASEAMRNVIPPTVITIMPGMLNPNAGDSFKIKSTPVTVTVTGSAPAFTSAGSATFTDGVSGTADITTAGNPNAALTETGALPAGLTLTDNRDGTATISGTPATGDAPGSYPITIAATNQVGSAQQTFTITLLRSSSGAGNPGSGTGGNTGGGTPEPGSSGSKPSSGGGSTKRAADALPRIRGSVKVGHTVTVVLPKWPAAVPKQHRATYAWFVAGKRAGSAARLKLKSAWRHKTLRVTVTVTWTVKHKTHRYARSSPTVTIR